MKRLLKKLSFKKDFDKSQILPEEELQKLRDINIYNTLDSDEKFYYDVLISWYPNGTVYHIAKKDSSFYVTLSKNYKIKGYNSLREMIKTWGFNYVYMTNGSLRPENELQESMWYLYPDGNVPSLTHIKENREDDLLYGQIDYVSKIKKIKFRELLQQWGFTILSTESSHWSNQKIIQFLRENFIDGLVSGLSVKFPSIYKMIQNRLYKTNYESVQEWIENQEWDEGVNFKWEVLKETHTTEGIVEKLRKLYPNGVVSKLYTHLNIHQQIQKIVKNTSYNSIQEWVENQEWKEGVNFTWEVLKLRKQTDEDIVQQLRELYQNGIVSNLQKNKNNIYESIRKRLKNTPYNSVQEWIENQEWKDGVNFKFEKVKTGPKTKKSKLIKNRYVYR